MLTFGLKKRSKVENESLLTKKRESIEVHVLEEVGYGVSDGFSKWPLTLSKCCDISSHV